jgi:N-methylhydantoinase B/oxoprolinase/acetone carboxylase alpha subunit
MRQPSAFALRAPKVEAASVTHVPLAECTWPEVEVDSSALTGMVYESMTPDDVLVNHSGGGGWGDPFERDPAAVLADVLNEYVSLEAARDDYGVAIDAATMTVDAAATAALRAVR